LAHSPALPIFVLPILNIQNASSYAAKKISPMHYLLLFIKYVLLLFAFAQTYAAQQTAAVVLSSTTKVIIEKDKIIHEKQFEIQINNGSGDQYTLVEIPYSSLIKTGNIEAFIRDKTGNIIKKLRQKDIITKSAISDFSLYEDNFVYTFRLKHNDYPYVLVYSYQLIQKEYLHIASWTPLLTTAIPCHKGQLTVVSPLDFGLRYRQKNIDAPIIDTAMDKIFYQWHGNYLQQITPQPFSPNLADLIPYVEVVPMDFKFEKKGSFNSWKTYGTWQNTIMQDLEVLPESEINNAQKTLKGSRNRQDTIKSLYHFLQDNTRYVNISIETGGLKPYSPAYVAKNKYGDCKALTYYFYSLLNQFNIESYYTKVYAGSSPITLETSFPSQQFNHIILFVPGEKESIWLDCTSDNAFNYLGTFTQNREALVIDGENTRFVKTPKLSETQVLETRTIEIRADENPVSIHVKNQLKGPGYELFSDLNNRVSNTRKEQLLQKYLLPKGFELAGYSISQTHRDIPSLSFHYDATSTQLIQEYGEDLLIQNILFDFITLDLPEERTLALQIDFPIHKSDTITYTFSEAIKLKNPSFFELTTKYGHYHSVFEIKENRLKIVKTLLIHDGKYPVTDYPDFYRFYQSVIDQENTIILCTKSN
jgi:hypothetical protein